MLSTSFDDNQQRLLILPILLLTFAHMPQVMIANIDYTGHLWLTIFSHTYSGTLQNTTFFQQSSGETLAAARPHPRSWPILLSTLATQLAVGGIGAMTGTVDFLTLSILPRPSGRAAQRPRSLATGH